MGLARGHAREDDSGDVVVVEVVVLDAAVKTVRQPPARRNRHRGKERLALHVANSEDVVDVGLLVLVHHDVTVLDQLEPDLLTAEVVGERVTADSPEEDIRADLLALVGVDGLGERLVDVRVLHLGGNLGDVRVGVNVDAGLDHVLLEGVLQHRVESLENLLVADEDVRLGTCKKRREMVRKGSREKGKVKTNRGYGGYRQARWQCSRHRR